MGVTPISAIAASPRSVGAAAEDERPGFLVTTAGRLEDGGCAVQSVAVAVLMSQRLRAVDDRPGDGVVAGVPAGALEPAVEVTCVREDSCLGPQCGVPRSPHAAEPLGEVL